MNRLTFSIIFALAFVAGASQALAQTLTRPPELTRFVEAEYPPSALEEGREASVVLEITIDARGRVSDVNVFESADPEFDAAAIAAARQFEFVPAEFDGVPGPIRIHYKYDFRLPAPPPVKPMSVISASPGPFTTQPMIDRLIGVLMCSSRCSRISTVLITSNPCRAQLGQEMICTPRVRSPSDFRIS